MIFKFLVSFFFWHTDFLFIFLFILIGSPVYWARFLMDKYSSLKQKCGSSEDSTFHQWLYGITNNDILVHVGFKKISVRTRNRGGDFYLKGIDKDWNSQSHTSQISQVQIDMWCVCFECKFKKRTKWWWICASIRTLSGTLWNLKLFQVTKIFDCVRFFSLFVGVLSWSTSTYVVFAVYSVDPIMARGGKNKPWRVYLFLFYLNSDKLFFS